MPSPSESFGITTLMAMVPATPSLSALKLTVPRATAVTRPLEVIVAMFVLPEDQ